MNKPVAFSQEDLNEIFKTSPKNPDRVISRESSSLEFKESFGWKSLAKYLRTASAFANTKGGYIVFGIANRPHKLVGLFGARLEAFENIDSEKLTMHLNEHFAPEISWDIQEYDLNGKTYGLLYIFESREKPVVCTKEAGKELKEGDIYYRYRGRTERIKYPELKYILEQKRENEQRLWMQHLTQIARIGVVDVGIFDLQTGQVTGTQGSFLIDESLLSQLSFIKEGEFSEIKGKPALKLIGEVKVINDLPSATGRRQVLKIKGIRISDIVLAFLDATRVVDPQEHIKQICFESTAFLPVHFFIQQQNIDTKQAIELIKSVLSRSPAKSRLIERLEKRITQCLQLPMHDTLQSRQKRAFAQQLKQRESDLDLAGEDLKRCLQAIRGLTPKEVKQLSKYLRELLKTWFNRHYTSMDGAIADNLRRAICWVDEALYMEGVE